VFTSGATVFSFFFVISDSIIDMPRPRRKLTVDHFPITLCHEGLSLVTYVSLAWESNHDLQFLWENGNDRQKSLEVWL
jgi:hypothetical protein